MSESRTLLEHRWPSSRRADENCLGFYLQDGKVCVYCTELWDHQEEDQEDSVGVEILTPAFCQVIDQLQRVDGPNVTNHLPGIEVGTALSFKRNEADVTVSCHGPHKAIIVSLPLEKLAALRIDQA